MSHTRDGAMGTEKMDKKLIFWCQSNNGHTAFGDIGGGNVGPL